MFPGDGNGMFAAPTPISVDGGPDSLAVGDVDGDGQLDIVTANVDGDNVTVLLSTAP